MQKILSLIEQRKQEFAQLPLFGYMRDQSINPRQRLAFAPCMAHFIMSFSDMNKYILRTNKTTSKIQEIINTYTYEDDNHWPWFISDIENLGFNNLYHLTDALQFIWGEETNITRQIAYQVAAYSLQAEPIIKFVVIQALEATSDEFFSISTKIASELKTITKKEYLFFGDVHFHEETGHTMNTPEAEDFLTQIKLTDSQREQALDVVNKIFQIFTDWTYELLTYAQKHPVEPVISKEASTALALCV